jgi:hypothetical protein
MHAVCDVIFAVEAGDLEKAQQITKKLRSLFPDNIDLWRLKCLPPA